MLDDAVEEKDGGEKVRLGMVVCVDLLRHCYGYGANFLSGHQRKLSCHARGTREDRRGSPRRSLRSSEADDKMELVQKSNAPEVLRGIILAIPI